MSKDAETEDGIDADELLGSLERIASLSADRISALIGERSELLPLVARVHRFLGDVISRESQFEGTENIELVWEKFVQAHEGDSSFDKHERIIYSRMIAFVHQAVRGFSTDAVPSTLEEVIDLFFYQRALNWTNANSRVIDSGKNDRVIAMRKLSNRTSRSHNVFKEFLVFAGVMDEAGNQLMGL